LADRLVGERIERVWIKRGSRLLRDTVGPGRLKKALAGGTIEALGRRGKYLIIVLDSGDFLVAHLGMTGKLYVIGRDEKQPPHTHLRFELSGGHDLIMVDPRTFGRVLYAKAGELDSLAALGRLGPEPLGPEFTSSYLGAALAGRKAPVKSLLLDQSVAAGVGNIYADEACFGARINPLRRSGDLSDKEVGALCRSLRRVLGKSIERKGTTIRDYEWDAGRSGGFADKLKVYGREGGRCKRCGSPVAREVVAGRSTFFCRGCQS